MNTDHDRLQEVKRHFSSEAGELDVICKFYNGAVYGGVKKDI